MPLPGPIRKEILSALENSILPMLRQRKVPLGYMTLPLAFPPEISIRLLSKTEPRIDLANATFPIQSNWPQANLISFVYPFFGFLYEGVADERTLVTTEQSAKFNLPKGVYAVRWQAPCALFIPPGAPRAGGHPVLWEDPTPVPPKKILWMVWGTETLLHTHINEGNAQPSISHSLQINDPDIYSLRSLLMEELQNTRTGEQSPAQAILLAMMLRLQKKLRAGHAKIANTSRLPVSLPESLSPSDHAGALCRETAIFIHMHLHEPLTLPVIAKEIALSPAHLNRLFQRIYGISVMRYVRAQRIAASQKILDIGTENIAEVAQLVGFKRASLFCRAFRKETGLTPGQYQRDRNLTEKTNDRN